MKQRSPILLFWYRYRIEIMMWATVGDMLISPLADYHRRLGGILGLVVLSVILIGVQYVDNKGVVRYAVLPAAAVWILARILEAYGDPQSFYTQLAPIAGLLLSCSILWAIFDHFHSVPRAPRSAIAEAFLSYLIISIAFSQLYWIINRFADHPFNQIIPYSQTSTLLYFSMITLSGVGYGGIVPLNPYLRLIAAMENMAGIFFVAVIVARFVSSYKPTPRSTVPHEE